MGDRGNIGIVQHPNGDDPDRAIYLYAHWGGSELPFVLQVALRRGRDRWDQEGYLTRIIFSSMIRGDLEETVGYGISTYLLDNDHPIIYVDVVRQLITVGRRSWTFDAYVDIAEDELMAAYASEPAETALAVSDEPHTPN